MDKSRVQIVDTRQLEYQNGVEAFLTFAYANIDPQEKIRCPCNKCNSVYFRLKDDVRADLLYEGIRKDYNPWTLHWEEANQFIDDEYDSIDESDDEYQENVHYSYFYSDHVCGQSVHRADDNQGEGIYAWNAWRCL